MKTTKPPPADISAARRAQPLRQTRNNPPRSSVAASRAFASRASRANGLESATASGQPVDIFPAITHFADAITALPKEIVRHFTLLKEVDAKIFAPEDDLGKLVDMLLSIPSPRQQTHQLQDTTKSDGFVPTSASGTTSGPSHSGSSDVPMQPENVDSNHHQNPVWDPDNLQRRQLFQNCAYTMQNMLVSLDEKNHVISTAVEALGKQMMRIDDCFPYIDFEISEEARYGSLTHWAYPENRMTSKTAASRREAAVVNNLAAAAAQSVEEAAARSESRKQAMLAKRGRQTQVDSDFDEHKDKKTHGNTKARKVVDAAANTTGSGPGLNGNPIVKRRRVEKPLPGAPPGMERALSGILGSNGSMRGRVGSPRDTPGPEGTKKRARGGAASNNGPARKRNNTVTSAMSPSIASSPIRSTFPDIKPARNSPAPTNGGRPASVRARQNSTHSILDSVRQIADIAPSGKQNGVEIPDLGTAATMTGRTIHDVKVSMKEVATTSRSDHLLEDINQQEPSMIGGILVGTRPLDTTKREETEINGTTKSTQPLSIQTTLITTKSGRASKPSTPALASFPEQVRARASRNTSDNSLNKRSHKKGAGLAAQQIVRTQQHNRGPGLEDESGDLHADDEDDAENDGDADETKYCFCDGPSYGEMVGCDGDNCEREWFHLECVGLKFAPKSDAKWYCATCRDRMRIKR